MASWIINGAKSFGGFSLPVPSSPTPYKEFAYVSSCSENFPDDQKDLFLSLALMRILLLQTWCGPAGNRSFELQD